MEKEPEQQNQSAEAMQLFFSEFGNIDIYTKIALEEFFKAIIDGE